MTQLQARLSKLEAKTKPAAEHYDPAIVWRNEDVYQLDNGEIIAESEAEYRRFLASRPRPPKPDMVTVIEIICLEDRSEE